VGGAVISALVLAMIVDWAGADDAVVGLVVGLSVAGGLLVTDSVKRFVYERGPLELLAINNGYVLVGFGLMGAALGTWQ
jgi:hypothetical protein